MGSVFTRIARPLAVACALGIAAATALPARAQATTVLSGSVNGEGGPVSGAAVTAVGNNLTVRAATDAKGRFVFVGIPIGGEPRRPTSHWSSPR
jgi:hypothetical protein